MNFSEILIIQEFPEASGISKRYFVKEIELFLIFGLNDDDSMIM